MEYILPVVIVALVIVAAVAVGSLTYKIFKDKQSRPWDEAQVTNVIALSHLLQQL